MVSGFGCSVSYTGPVPCTAGATNLDAKHLESPEYGFRNRANLTWKITPDILVYYTYSEGYRPGGFNRRAPQTKIIVNGVQEVFVGPIAYQSDGLTNNEIGYKTQFFDHRLTVNGSFYQQAAQLAADHKPRRGNPAGIGGRVRQCRRHAGAIARVQGRVPGAL